MFPLFYKQVARELAPKVAVILRHLVNGGSVSTSWRLADVISALKESPSSNIAN